MFGHHCLIGIKTSGRSHGAADATGATCDVLLVWDWKLNGLTRVKRTKSDMEIERI